MFNENSLGEAICDTWGEHGAHAEVYADMRSRIAELEAEIERLRDAAEENRTAGAGINAELIAENERNAVDIAGFLAAREEDRAEIERLRGLLERAYLAIPSRGERDVGGQRVVEDINEDLRYDMRAALGEKGEG